MDFQDRLGDTVTVESTGRVTIVNQQKGSLYFRCRCSPQDGDESTLLIQGDPSRISGNLNPEAVIQLICCVCGLDYRLQESSYGKAVYEIVQR
jgi:hypothetical protein